MVISPPNLPFVLVLSAPSGVGKTTLGHLLIHDMPRLRMGVTYTTRPQRDCERQGIDYHFVSKEGFEERIRKGHFLECSQIYGHWYGTDLTGMQESLCQGDDVVLILDVRGAMQLKQRWRHGVFVFLLPPSMEELKARLMRRRTDTPDQIMQRLQCAQSEISFGLRHFDYVVVNARLNEALEDLKAIVRSHRLKRQDRMMWQESLLDQRGGQTHTRFESKGSASDGKLEPEFTDKNDSIIS